MKVKVYSDIANESESCFFDFFGIERKVFSAEGIKDMLADNPDEKKLEFDINCNGGSTREGFAIYDLLRTSGREIHCNIDGGCHSMATVILLAAPKENRTANPNSTALIHDVRAYMDLVSAEEAQDFADDLKAERNKILDIYADRTGYDRAKLEAILLEEREHTANELLEYGFISKINKYTTNLKPNYMSKKGKTFLNRLADFLRSSVNYDFTDEEGNVLFSTESEDDTLEIGMPASPDGRHELPDGMVVIITEGVITEFISAPSEEVEDLRNQVAELTAQLEAANTRNTEATNLLTEAQAELTRLGSVRSNAQIPARSVATGNAGRQNQKLTAEEQKKAVKEKLKGGKK